MFLSLFAAFLFPVGPAACRFSPDSVCLFAGRLAQLVFSRHVVPDEKGWALRRVGLTRPPPSRVLLARFGVGGTSSSVSEVLGRARRRWWRHSVRTSVVGFSNLPLPASTTDHLIKPTSYPMPN